MTNNDKYLRINKEINYEWLKKVIKKLNKLELLNGIDDGKKLTNEEIDEMIRTLYYDLIKETNQKGSDLEIADIELIKNQLAEYISILDNDVTKKRIPLKEYKQKLVAYVSFLALLITIPSGMIIKSKKDSKETLYKTKSEACSFYKEYQENGSYIYKQNIYTFHDDYKPENESEDMVKIVEYSPWDVYKKQASQEIKTYNLFDVKYADIINSGDLDKYIMSIIPNEEVRYEYKNRINYDELKNEETVYKVVREIQDLSDKITVDSGNKDIFKIAIVFITELLLLGYVIEYNNTLVTKQILYLIYEVTKYNKLTKEEEKLINELTDKFKSLNSLELDCKRKIKQL